MYMRVLPSGNGIERLAFCVDALCVCAQPPVDVQPHTPHPSDLCEPVCRRLAFWDSITKARMRNATQHNPRRANGHRRDQVRQRVLREEHLCHLCGQLVEKTLPTPHPGSPEVDEIIPVSKGGSAYDRANCRLSHRACNRDRSDQDLRGYLARRTRPTVGDAAESITERRWW
ncbi:HNH endonuclease [Gordonia sp. DT101]|uniref:HNH endonuclease n=1 Tax=Gordonia sp. DT101 TaxID=3416545 RepID=UPI003CEF0E05